jgi:hypothetical protein
MVSVAITVDRAEAILAGNADFGVQVVRVDLDALNTEERRTLATCGAHENDSSIFRCTGLPTLNISYPKIAVADEAAVKQVLAAIGTSIQLMEDEQDKRIRQRRKQLSDRVREWLRKSDDDLVIASYGHKPGPTDVAKIWPLPPDFVSGAELDDPDLRPQVVARLQRLKAACDEHNAEVEKTVAANLARHDEAKKAAKAAAEAAERRAAEALTECIMRHGTPSQQERHRRGVLPREEALGLYRDRLFADLDSFPRYERLTIKDVAAAVNDDDGDDEYPGYKPEGDFNAWTAEELSEDEFATMQQIERVVTERLPTGTTVEARLHAGGYKGADDWAVYRKSVLVTVNGPVKVSREYACP